MIKENRLRQIADNMKVSWNRFKMVTELTEGFEDRLSYGFDLIKYHGNWENLTEESWEYLFNAKEHPLKGWSVNSRHKILSYLDVKDITGEIPITEKSEKELREIIEKCKKENLQVLFVATPWQVTEEEHQKDNYIKRIVEEAGFRFLDSNYYAEEMGLEYNVDFTIQSIPMRSVQRNLPHTWAIISGNIMILRPTTAKRWRQAGIRRPKKKKKNMRRQPKRY